MKYFSLTVFGLLLNCIASAQICEQAVYQARWQRVRQNYQNQFSEAGLKVSEALPEVYGRYFDYVRDSKQRWTQRLEETSDGNVLIGVLIYQARKYPETQKLVQQASKRSFDKVPLESGVDYKFVVDSQGRLVITKEQTQDGGVVEHIQLANPNRVRRAQSYQLEGVFFAGKIRDGIFDLNSSFGFGLKYSDYTREQVRVFKELLVELGYEPLIKQELN